MSEKAKYRLTLTEMQAVVVMRALDLFMRLRTGQVEEIGRDFRWREAAKDDVTVERLEQVDSVCAELKRLMFPQFSRNASYSICNPEAPDEARIACDVHDVVRHRLEGDRNPGGGPTLGFNAVTSVSSEPLPTMKSEKDE